MFETLTSSVSSSSHVTGERNSISNALTGVRMPMLLRVDMQGEPSKAVNASCVASSAK